jgi:hypothetical protein
VGGGARVLAEGPEQKRPPQGTPSGRKGRGCRERTWRDCRAGFADCQGLGAVEGQGIRDQVVSHRERWSAGARRAACRGGQVLAVRPTLTAPSESRGAQFRERSKERWIVQRLGCPAPQQARQQSLAFGAAA